MGVNRYIIDELGQTSTGARVYMIKGVNLDDILESRFNLSSELNMKINELKLRLNKGKNIVYRAFDPLQFKYVISEGTDRTPEYISQQDPYKSDTIYAGSLEKAMEHAREPFKERGLACLSLYDKDKLEEVDFYAYKPKTSFKDALLGVICLSESYLSDIYKSLLEFDLLSSRGKYR
ncbi:MAG: hypothetical protein BXU00_03180 [Candidatus Nanoclepta minutus]|uniref:Uncharacterized protein n=1 Tax=Candidatus Nanoclepta minutus TaxID=1940235 RepID=A0A397WM53_9ARCH|nr:MAG: hypothetical protein BXU00_03180 [Candidatus Nanoclepta minutus]